MFHLDEALACACLLCYSYDKFKVSYIMMQLPNVWQCLDQINVDACKAVHVGDDQKADKSGANAVGIHCW